MEYQATGTMQTCPYSKDIAIVTSENSKTDKSQCPHFKECAIDQCPLEAINKLKRY